MIKTEDFHIGYAILLNSIKRKDIKFNYLGAQKGFRFSF